MRSLCSTEMPAWCFLLSLAGELISLSIHDTQTLAVVKEMDLPFCCANSFFFILPPNWINWSNRRLSYPPCHAFYLSLIALSFPTSICLSTFRQYLLLLSLASARSNFCINKSQTFSSLSFFASYSLIWLIQLYAQSGLLRFVYIVHNKSRHNCSLNTNVTRLYTTQSYTYPYCMSDYSMRELLPWWMHGWVNQCLKCTEIQLLILWISVTYYIILCYIILY